MMFVNGEGVLSRRGAVEESARAACGVAIREAGRRRGRVRRANMMKQGGDDRVEVPGRFE